jgi:hypothetical protein
MADTADLSDAEIRRALALLVDCMDAVATGIWPRINAKIAAQILENAGLTYTRPIKPSDLDRGTEGVCPLDYALAPPNRRTGDVIGAPVRFLTEAARTLTTKEIGKAMDAYHAQENAQVAA